MTAGRDLASRVREAERLWSEGHSAGAHEAFHELFREIVEERGTVAAFGENEFLITQRYADLAAETGRIDDALDLYLALQRRAPSPEARAIVGFKRLHLAVETNELAARAAYVAIWPNTGLEEPPWHASDADLASWESHITWDESDRAWLLSLGYLALGRLHNALRSLTEACVLLERGLRHAEGAEDHLGRLSRIPLRIALAGTCLARGRFELCREHLDRAGEAVESESLGAVYSIWLGHARAKAALFEGCFGDALAHLSAVREIASKRGIQRAVAAALIAEAEVLILLNQVQAAEDRLDEARQSGAADVEQLDRVALLKSLRMRMFEPREGDEPQPAVPLVSLHPEDVVWTGDCLRDFERREAAVYALLDPKPSAAWEELSALWQDFESVESPLIRARLEALAGLLFLRSGDEARAAAYLGGAREIFREIGAERELYQATAYLVFAVEKSDPERYSRLIEENDLRLARLEITLTPEQRNAFRLNKYTAAEQKWRIHIERLLMLKERAEMEAWWRRPLELVRYWTSLWQFFHSLDAERRKQRKSTAGGETAPRPAGTWDMWRSIALHPRRHAVVSYVVLPDMTFVCSLRRWRLGCEALPLGRVEALNLVLSLRESLFSVERVDSKGFDHLAKQTCEELGLQAILGSMPRRIRQLTIVPDDELRRLPFCALRYGRQDGAAAYLVEDFALNIDDVVERNRERRPLTAKGIAGYSERKLPEAAKAAYEAAAWLRTGWLLDCPATDQRTEFLSRIADATAIYYFGHGWFHATDPSRCGVELQGPGGVELLSLPALDAIDFGGLEQAVLLACHGGEARPFPGRWTLSLPEMLLRRGAHSVLSSMWVLDQRVATRVSGDFLRNAGPKGRAVSLAEIQRWFIGHRNHPYTWAGLYVFGEAGPIRTRRRLWRY